MFHNSDLYKKNCFNTVVDLAMANKKDPFYTHPRPMFQFEKDGTWHFDYVVDMRWTPFAWQKREIIRQQQFPKRFHVYEMPRRHGKTYYFIRAIVSFLLNCVHMNPLGAYYCVDKGQAVRNAWSIFMDVIRPIPGAHADKTDGVITIPLPRLDNPSNMITINFFGIRGGSATKRGGGYSIMGFDEVEFIGIPFIEDVGMGSILDKDGHLWMMGTPHDMGNLDYWLDKAQKACKIEAAVNAGIMKPDDPRVPYDYKEWHWKRENCYTLKVYTKEQLKMQEAIMSKEAFQREFMCVNPVASLGFYHRREVDKASDQGRISPMITYDPNVPIRVYFDLGLGTKSDQMAFGVFQFFPGGIRILYGQNVHGKGYIQACKAVRECPYGKKPIAEVVLPHDAKVSEQSDAVPKWEKFEKALREQGIGSPIRVQSPTTDKLMDIDLVTAMMHKIFISEIDAYDIVDALRNHKRKYNKVEATWQSEPSKTKYRDLADVVRHACVDYNNDDYLDSFPDDTQFGQYHRPDGNINEWRSVGYHPSAGSVIIGPDGTMLPMEGVGVADDKDAEMFMEIG